MPPPMIPPPTGVVLPSYEEVMAASAVRPRMPVLPILAIITVVMVASAFVSDPTVPAARMAQWALAIMFPLVTGAAAVGWGAYQAGRLRDEEAAVEQIEGAVRMRRFDMASWQLLAVLSHPMLSPMNRARALGAFLTTLARIGRFDESALMVDAMLAEGVPMGMVAPLRAVKAYVLLREDRLVDADRAVTDIRKMGRDGFSGAVLALAETYREVRTGHTEDLLAAHDKRRIAVAEELGHRVSDLDALAAWAAMTRKDDNLAKRLWRRATIVGQIGELVDRYPELKEVASRFTASPVPAELIGATAGGRP